MQILVVSGLVLVAAALATLGYCIFQAFAIRAHAGDPADTRVRLKRLATINLAALAAAGLGLALVTAGLLL